MRRGARSIRGAMGAYALAGALAVAVLAAVLWVGWPEPPRSEVELAADAPWSSAVLDDGHTLRTVERGARVDAPPGEYRLTLLGAEGGADGGADRRTLRVSGELTIVR